MVYAVRGFSPFRVEKLREAVMRGCYVRRTIHDRRSIHVRRTIHAGAMHPRKAFRFSACTPHPARQASPPGWSHMVAARRYSRPSVHSASLRYIGAVARFPRVAMVPCSTRASASLLLAQRALGSAPPQGEGFWGCACRFIRGEAFGPYIQRLLPL